ncbi:unnamed protein product [Echinostoma caproni]|uniref:SH3 domain-containing protein n=1 Tax=Echinostoma caproni TaxID=27848 RepID=A0A183ANY9_9TREM|nr:unnamed protein product [Echinostoma caproni]
MSADFTGSTPRELSFQQGDDLFLYRRLNDHWWEGQLASDSTGTRGLVPHLYVIPKAALACLAGLGGDTTGMDRSQYDGIGDEDEDEDDEAEDEEEEERDEKSAKKVTESRGKGEAPNVANTMTESTDSGSFKPSTKSDDVETKDNGKPHDTSEPLPAPAPPPSPPSSPPRHSSPAKSSRLPEPSLAHDYSSSSSTPQSKPHTHSTKLVISPSALSRSSDSPERLSPSLQGLVDSETKPTHSESAPTSPIESTLSDVGTSSSSPVIPRRCKSPSTESPRSASLRHTVSYPLSGGLGAVPEDEAVMRGLSSLEQADSQDSDFRTLQRTRELSRKLQLPCAKHTPDLVMDLPVQTAPSTEGLVCSTPSSVSSNPGTAATLIDGSKSSADNFAEQGMDTMRKRPEPRALISRVPAFTRREGVDFKTRLNDSLTSTTAATTTTTTAVSVPGAGEPKRESLDPAPTKVAEDSQSSSIAARVAAFEGFKSQNDASFTRSVPRPPLAPKPKRS